MDLTNQRRMAAEILKCGENRVYMNPNNIEDISEAVTRGDIRRLIHEGIIKARQVKGISTGRKKARMDSNPKTISRTSLLDSFAPTMFRMANTMANPTATALNGASNTSAR